MFNWLTPLTSILATQNDELDFSEKGKSKEASKPLLHTFLHAPPPALLDLVNGLSDDIYAFSRYALLDLIDFNALLITFKARFNRKTHW